MSEPISRICAKRQVRRGHEAPVDDLEVGDVGEARNGGEQIVAREGSGTFPPPDERMEIVPPVKTTAMRGRATDRSYAATVVGTDEFWRRGPSAWVSRIEQAIGDVDCPDLGR